MDYKLAFRYWKFDKSVKKVSRHNFKTSYWSLYILNYCSMNHYKKKQRENVNPYVVFIFVFDLFERDPSNNHTYKLIVREKSKWEWHSTEWHKSCSDWPKNNHLNIYDDFGWGYLTISHCDTLRQWDWE